MTKPHEETWDYDGRWLRVTSLQDEDGYPEQWACADHGDDPKPRARLAAAAPEMARLLLERFETHARGDSGADSSDWYCNFCHHAQEHMPDCKLVAVLKRAGVLP